MHPSTHVLLKIKRGDIAIPTVERNVPRSVPGSVGVRFDANPTLITVPRSVPEQPSIPVPVELCFDANSIPVTVPRSVPEQSRVPVPVELPSDANPVPVTVSGCSVGSNSPPIDASGRVPPVPSFGRLREIRAQAERRLNARRQQLQSYPFTEGSAVDPIIEERILRERKEAEEKARMMDQEIEELEKARRRKHDDALKQTSRPYLESVKAAFANTPEVYQHILKLLIQCLGTTDDSYVMSLYVLLP